MKNLIYQLGKFIIVIVFLLLCSCENSKQKEIQNKELQNRAVELLDKETKIRNITAVLKTDSEISNFTNHDPEKQAIAMRKIDISNCPPEFALAYLEHIHAWEKLSVTYKVIKQWNSDENINNIIVQSYFNEILNTNINTFKNVIEIENELRNQFANDQKIIRETYYSAEKIAVKFGAKLPSKN